MTSVYDVQLVLFLSRRLRRSQETAEKNGITEGDGGRRRRESNRKSSLVINVFDIVCSARTEAKERRRVRHRSTYLQRILMYKFVARRS